MSLHALDAIDDALTATASYRPRGLRAWLWAGVVATAVASPGIGVPTGGGGELTAEDRAVLEEPLAAVSDFLLLVGVAAVALWALFVLAGALLEFPFLRWLRDGEFALRAEVRRHWRQGLQLAAFRFGLQGVSLAILVAVAAAVVGTDPTLPEVVFALSERQFVLGLLGLGVGVVGAFTTAFVVPAMVLRDRGVLGGWRRVWPVLAGAPKQVLAYAVGVAVLGTAGGLLVGLAAVAVFIPVLLVAVLVGVAVSGTAGVAVGAVLGGTAMTVAVVGTYTVVQIYLRYYALFVLGDLDGDLDYLPERRREVRET